MLDSEMIPVARLFRLIRLDASNVMRRAFHQLTDQATRLISDFTARGGWSGLESLRFTGVPRVKFTHQGIGAGLHQLDQIQEEDVPVLIAKSVDGVGHRTGIMQDCETIADVLKVAVLFGRSCQFLLQVDVGARATAV